MDMFWSLSKMLPKKFLGIDIGTFSIKVVELSRWGKKRKLENYGEIKASSLYKKPFRIFNKSTLLLSSYDIAQAIKVVIEEGKIKTRQVTFSIPDFSSFFTNFELPVMTKEELSQAVKYEARLHVPLPLAKVTLDWIVVGENVNQRKGEKKLKILLVAIPNEVIRQYSEIATMANLQLFSLEAEAFGLLRSLDKKEEKDQVIALLDIGAQSTTCSIIDNGVLKTSYSFDMSGNKLTLAITKAFGIDHKTAEKFKKKYGLLPEQELRLETEKNVREVLLPLIDVILKEVKKVLESFYQQERKGIQKIIIAGSTVLLPGLVEYFQDNFNQEIKITNPFSNIFYLPVLENTLKNMGPAYAISVGVALRGLE